VKKWKGWQVGEHTKEGKKTALRERLMEEGELGVEIDPATRLSGSFQSSRGTSSKRKIGVGGVEGGRGR